MSEVQSFWCHEASNILCVRASDFDRVTAELQRQLDHKEQQRESELRNGQAGDRLVGELQQRLNAADERVDELEGLLREAMPALDLAAGSFKSAKPVRNKVRAALKPAEAKLCKTCNGTGIVSDGAMYCSSGGIPFECGPIECVKDCPECTKP